MLRRRIRNKDFPRLRSRANKAASGKKARTGAFFTPEHCVENCLSEIERAARSAGTEIATFLDPCCGTGRYLIRAAKRFALDPGNLHGFDTDPQSIRITQSHLPECPNIRRQNFLTSKTADALANRIDAIASNPPWGAESEKRKERTGGGKTEREKKPGKTRTESFALFLEKSLNMLRPGGVLSFLLPEAVLHVKAHANIRQRMAQETTMLKISLLGRVFPDVFTPVIRLVLLKTPAPGDWMTTIENAGATYRVPQKRFTENPHCAFDATMTEEDSALLRKIYSAPHRTLRGNAEWALGIVTGDNARHVLPAPVPDAEPLLRGRDITKFTARPPQAFIRHTPEKFHQTAPGRLYRAPEKLLYRFISDKLVFAYDATGALPLNSANAVIPKIPGLSVKAALAFLNSRVFQYIFTKRFHTGKVLRGDLETLPFPAISAKTRRALETLVTRCIRDDSHAAAEEKLNALVEKIFGLPSGFPNLPPEN